MTIRQSISTETFHYKTRIPVRFADIDAFGHVNNAIYLTYFEIVRSAYWNEIIEWDWNSVGIILRNSHVEYLKPIMLNDEVYAYVKTSRIGGSSFDLEYLLVKIINGEEQICTSGSTLCVTYDYNAGKPVPIPDYQRKKMENL